MRILLLPGCINWLGRGEYALIAIFPNTCSLIIFKPFGDQAYEILDQAYEILCSFLGGL